MEQEEAKRTQQSERVKELIKSDDFKDLLCCLALKIKELDTVRDVDHNQDYQNIAVRQLAKKMSIDIIEQWLDDILGIASYGDFIDNNIEKTNDIIKRFK